MSFPPGFPMPPSPTASTYSSFDSTGADGAKVQRVKRACVTCFTAKVRCSGELPCGRCSDKAFSCYYDPAGNSRNKKRRRGVSVDQQETPVNNDRGGSSTSSAAVYSREPTNIQMGVDCGEPLEVPTPPVVVRQPFFRWLGVTAVAPPLEGAPFRSLSVAVREVPAPSPSAQQKSPPPQPTSRDLATEAAQSAERVRTFYALLESYLPYLPLQETLGRLATGTLSEVVLVSMSALVKRMRPETPCMSAEKLADRAKALIIAHLALPTLDTVYALLLLAYHEHGADRDSGLWAYAGMAIRASIDLGLHKSFEAADAAETALRSRVFWGVACLDRILSCGTGRVTTIPLSQIEIPPPLPRANITTSQGVSLPDPFPSLCRLLVILGNVSDAANTTLPLSGGQLQALQLELAEYQAALPTALQFSIHTFSAYVSAGYAQVFLLLSVWHLAVHLAIHEAALLYPQSPEAASEYALTSLSGSSAISIADMLAYSDVIFKDAFLATPTLSQAILMAGRTASALLTTLPTSTPFHKRESLERSVTICQSTLVSIQQLWKGLSWHVETLTKNLREADYNINGATITTEDKGMVARARIEDMARKYSWISELSAFPENGQVVGVGVSLSGVTTELASLEPPQSTVAVIRSGPSSPILWNNDSSGPASFSQDVFADGFWTGNWSDWQSTVDTFPTGERLDGFLSLP